MPRVEEGEGDKPEEGADVEVDYTGTQLDGTEFDASSLSFTLGAGELIAGFEEAVTLMNRGETARIILPSHLAYQYTNLPRFAYFADGPEPVGILQFEIHLR